jgi:hypothetical protein
MPTYFANPPDAQTAINSAISGDTVSLNDGLYSHISPKTGVNIVATNPGMAVIDGPTDGQDVDLVGAGYTDLNFDDMVVGGGESRAMGMFNLERVNIRRSRFVACNQGVQGGPCRDTVISDCEFYGNGTLAASSSQTHQLYLSGFNIAAPWALTGVEILRCVFYDPHPSSAEQLHVNNNNANNTLPYDGLIVGECRFFNCNTSMDDINLQSTKDAVVRNCLTHTLNSGGGAADCSFAGTSGLICEDTTFVNCTFIGPNKVGVKQRQQGTGTRVFNSIILVEDVTNAVSNPSGNPIYYLDGNNILAQWSDALADELFVDWRNGDWRLNPGCAAHGTGLSSYMGVAAPTTDIDGTARGGYDIGAFAAAGTVPPPEPPPPPDGLITGRLWLPLINPVRRSWYVPHNTALGWMDAMAQASVVAVGETAPPVGPQDGDRYVLGAAPSGAWAGFDEHDVVLYANGSWYARPSRVGYRVYDQTAAGHYVFTGSSWIVWP